MEIMDAYEGEEKIKGLKRRQEILRRLEEQGEIFTQALAKEFGVSAMTIRRDLHFFAGQGIVEMHYGGAHMNRPQQLLPSFSARNEQLLHYKLEIGRKAASFLREGDVIFLDSSTTVVQMIRYFPDIHATIITNSIKAVQQFCTNRKVNLIIAPGAYQEQIGGCMDYSTVEFLKKYHADKAFIGAEAANPDFGLSSPQELDGALKRTFWEQADASFLMADHTKFSKKSLVKYNELKDFTHILTNRCLEDELKTKILRQNRGLTLC